MIQPGLILVGQRERDSHPSLGRWDGCRFESKKKKSLVGA
jgi:hypothetical protein